MNIEPITANSNMLPSGQRCTASPRSSDRQDQQQAAEPGGRGGDAGRLEGARGQLGGAAGCRRQTGRRPGRPRRPAPLPVGGASAATPRTPVAGGQQRGEVDGVADHRDREDGHRRVEAEVGVAGQVLVGHPRASNLLSSSASGRRVGVGSSAQDPGRRSGPAGRRPAGRPVLQPVVVALGQAADGYHGTTRRRAGGNPHEHPAAADHQRADQAGQREQRGDQGDELAGVVPDRQPGEPLDAVEADAAPAVRAAGRSARARARCAAGRPCRP